MFNLIAHVQMFIRDGFSTLVLSDIIRADIQPDNIIAILMRIVMYIKTFEARLGELWGTASDSQIISDTISTQ